MTVRTLIGLAAALVVLTLLALLGQRGSGSADRDTVDTLLLPELESALDRIDEVAVAAAGDTPVATLQRREQRWVVAEKDDYPADIGRIREVLRALSEARIVEQKTSNPAYYDRLGVEPIDDDSAAGVEITASAGDSEIASVIVGDTAGSGYHYARRRDDETSYMVGRELDVPRAVAEWVDPTIVDIRGARVQQVTIEHPDGETLRIYKNGEQDANFSVDGVPEGRELQYPGVANVIGNALRELRLEDVEAADGTPEDAAPVRTTFRTFDGLVVTVEGVSRGDDGAWVVVAAEVAADVDAGEAGSASADEAAEQAPEAAADPETATAAGETGEDPDAATTNEPQNTDPQAEAREINERVAGWRYRIPSYQFDQMSRRLDDLLQAEE